MSYEEKSIADLVKEIEKNDEFGTTTISKYVDFNQRETIETIDAYLNSKHISGSTDHAGREKPFFNICTMAVNTWFRATDLDRKNIKVKADKSSNVTTAFLATCLLQDWMRRQNFGIFLNEWGRTMARYGSTVSKFVEKDGELHPEVIPWNRLLSDPVDFNNNVKIEILWLTGAQLRRNKSYNKELVEQLLDNPVQRQTMDKQNKDTKTDYYKVYEVHGELPLSYLTDNEEDDDTYVQQMHVLTFQAKTDGKNDEGFTLYRGKEARDPYHIAHLIPEDGRALAIGAVEHLFDAQWMVNHSQKQIKDQLDLASKLLFQTSDGNFVGQNALTNIENGDILIHNINQPLTQLSNQPNISAMQAFQAQWQTQGNQINGISEAMMGANQPSGSAWRQTQALLQESHSLFEIMTENKGLYLEEILRKFIIPHFKKKLDTSEEVMVILEDYQIKQLDEMYAPNEAVRMNNDIIKKTILSGQIYDPTQQTGEIAANEAALRKSLESLGNQRAIKPSDIDSKTWKEIFKDLEWDLEIEITGEQKDIQGTLATLTTLLQYVVGNPAFLQDPNIKLIFSKILEISGAASPIEIKQAASQPMMQTPAPAAPMMQ